MLAPSCLSQDMTEAELWSVVKPKAVGPEAVAAASLPLLSQVSFSSSSALWSQPAAGHYAAANAVLDSTAARTSGRLLAPAWLPTTVLPWLPSDCRHCSLKRHVFCSHSAVFAQLRSSCA